MATAEKPYILTARVAGGTRLEADVASLADASRLWNQFRDGVAFGGSGMTSQPTVKDINGKKVAFISYNGVVWPPKRWEPGMERLMESQDGPEHDCADYEVNEAPSSGFKEVLSCSRCHTLLSVNKETRLS